MDDWSIFVDGELIPAIWSRLDTIFPELNWTKKGGNWVSKYHLNGVQDSDKAEVTYCYKNNKHLFIDQSRPDTATEVIKYYENTKGVRRGEAIRKLADICGLEPPKGANDEYWEQWRQERDAKAAKARKYQDAIWTEEGRPALDYMRGRGWRDEEIRNSGIGFKEGRHCLVLPWYSCGAVTGFNSRLIDEPQGEETKYWREPGTKKDTLWGISTEPEIIVVEGELDAMRLRANGFAAVATGGGAITENQAADAIKKGVKTFVLAYDNDDKGDTFTEKSVRLLQRKEIQDKGVQVYVAEPFEGAKDADEYLSQGHTCEELRSLFDNRRQPEVFLGELLISRMVEAQEAQNGPLNAKQRDELLNGLAEILCNPRARTIALMPLLKTLNETNLGISREDFIAFVAGLKGRKLAENAKAEMKGAINAATAALERLDIAAASAALEGAARAGKKATNAETFAEHFAPILISEFDNLLADIPEGLPTGYEFSENEPFTLNPGITFVCAPTGHGKTSMCTNIALNVCNWYKENGLDKSVLFLSYEISKPRVLADFLDLYCKDIELNASKSPVNAILDFMKGNTKWIKENALQTFLSRKNEFVREYLQTGALVVADEPFRLETLLAALDYQAERTDMGLVVLDYAQLIYSEEATRARTEEIKRVVNDIKDWANKRSIPVLMAAQFNRQVTSALTVTPDNIGEGGDFERIADTVVGLWNCTKHAQVNAEDRKTLVDLAEKLKIDDAEPSILCRLLKRRYGTAPLDIVLPWDGAHKYIAPNVPNWPNAK